MTPVVWDDEGEPCHAPHPEHGYRCDLIVDHDGWAHYYELDHDRDTGVVTEIVRWQNHPLREFCPSCGYEAGPTSLMYHLTSKHPDLLVTTPYTGSLP